ncbi:MAG TPA: hypothetical protein VHW96_20565 [Solirubrobacteraceae bacterium]|jgi:hypothetical protein|nr:hypothetical protein [Solirubrobacteraceae bacterium]
MAERTRSEGPGAKPATSPRPDAPIARHPAAAGALALQRTVGNRAATQVLQRWAAHPDKDKKGVLMPDEMASEFNRFNPPLSK